MSATPAHPTPYPDVNAVLAALLAGVQAILGSEFVGLYLYGSLASGDFDLQRSDIDFVVVTTGDLSDETIADLEGLHRRIAASGQKWASKLEGSYIPWQALRRYRPGDPPWPQFNEGRFFMEQHGSDWVIQRHVLREHGVVVAGPAIRTLIDPVHPDDLKQAVLGVLHGWWADMLRQPIPRLHDGDFQAFTVLTMCRALHTLHFGTLISKPVAACWALAVLDGQWSGLIERALVWQPAVPVSSVDETLDFIRYTLECSRKFERPPDER
jgi:hypothetical protein